MELNVHNWPYKWFGVWREYGSEFAKCPSIRNFIDKARNETYEKDRLVKYLMSGRTMAVTSAISFPSPFTSQPGRGSVAYRTDGTWIWLDTLAEYIEKNDVVIPDSWYSAIVSRKFFIPEIDDDQLMNLEWPKL